MAAERRAVYDWPGGRLRIVADVGPVVDEHGTPTLIEHTVDERECVPLDQAGYAFPARLPVTDEEHGVRIELGVVAGRVECIGIRALEGTSLRVQTLRGLSLRQVIREQTPHWTLRVMRTTSGEIIGVRVGPGWTPSGVFSFADVIPPDVSEVADRLVRGYRTLTPDFLEQVAAVYRDALAHRLSTQKEVQRLLGPTTATNARRWIARARKEGYLGPRLAERMPGEATTATGGDNDG